MNCEYQKRHQGILEQINSLINEIVMLNMRGWYTYDELCRFCDISKQIEGLEVELQENAKIYFKKSIQ